MHLTLRQLQIFVAICESGSTVPASRQVSLSQSATSAALKELEFILDAHLFDRVGKRLVLNDNGRSLLPQARALLDGAQAIESQFSLSGGPAASLLKLGASTTIGNYVMPALLAQFRRHEPAVRIDMHIGNTSEVAAQVADFKVDVGFIEGPSREIDLEVVPWLPDELVIVSSRHHPLARRASGAKVTANELRKAEWLLREPGSGTREAADQVLLPHLHHVNEAMVLGNTEAIKRAVAENLGLSCLSRWVVADMLATGQLTVLRTTLPPLPRWFYLIRHKKKVLSAGLERFIELCRSSSPTPD